MTRHLTRWRQSSTSGATSPGTTLRDRWTSSCASPSVVSSQTKKPPRSPRTKEEKRSSLNCHHGAERTALLQHYFCFEQLDSMWLHKHTRLAANDHSGSSPPSCILPTGECKRALPHSQVSYCFHDPANPFLTVSCRRNWIRGRLRFLPASPKTPGYYYFPPLI